MTVPVFQKCLRTVLDRCAVDTEGRPSPQRGVCRATSAPCVRSRGDDPKRRAAVPEPPVLGSLISEAGRAIGMAADALHFRAHYLRGLQLASVSAGTGELWLPTVNFLSICA